MDPSNDNDPQVQVEIGLARMAHSDEDWDLVECEHAGSYDWDPSRPLREQWPWNGEACSHNARADVMPDEETADPVCTARHVGECQPAAWGDGPAVCVVPLRAQPDDRIIQAVGQLGSDAEPAPDWQERVLAEIK